jgi:transposase
MDLADENARLRAALAERDAQLAEHKFTLAAREAQIAEHKSTLAAREAQIADLRERLAAAEDAAQRLQRDVEKLKRQVAVAATRSERVVSPEDEPAPTPPAGEPPTPPDEATADDVAPNPPPEPKRKRKKDTNDVPHGRRDLSEADLPEVLVRGDVPPGCSCAKCGKGLKSMGPQVSYRVELVPAHYVRHRIEVEQCVCPDHPEIGVTSGTLPVSYALPRALCGNTLLAQVITDKYADHLPLARQEGRFERSGFHIARATLCDWMMATGDAVRPIVNCVRLQVLAEAWVRSDATGVPVRKDELRGRTHLGHFWCYGNHDQVVFEYTADKRAETVAALFPGFKGTIVIDGATDFNLLEKVEGVERAGCWAHARRYFYEALKADSKRATEALVHIRKLFLAERIVMSAPEDQRSSLRDELCRPILDGFRVWLDELFPQLEPKNALHAAVQYTRNQWSRLVVILRNHAIPAHNNDSERDLRKAVTGRRNWLVAGSERGARAMANFYTLIGSCLLQGIDPRAYLEEILGRLDEPPRRLTPAAIREQWDAAARERAGTAELASSA